MRLSWPDRERVEHLFTLYERLADPLTHEGARQNRRAARRATRETRADRRPPSSD